MAPRRRPSDAELEAICAELREAGAERKQTADAHAAAVERLAGIVSEARRLGVKIATIEAEGGVKKQWIYEQVKYRDRMTRHGSQPVAQQLGNTESK